MYNIEVYRSTRNSGSALTIVGTHTSREIALREAKDYFSSEVLLKRAGSEDSKVVRVQVLEIVEEFWT